MSDFALDTLEYPRVLELLGRFLVSPLARASLPRLRPFGKREQMDEALAQVRELVDYLEQGGRLPVPVLPDLRTWIRELGTGSRRANALDLAALLKAMRSSARLKRILSELEADGYPALLRLGERFPDLDAFSKRLENTIDDRGELLSSASPKLAEIRGEIGRAEAQLRAALDRVLADPYVRKSLQSQQVTWRSGRPALAVKPEARRAVRGILHDRSQSGQTVFIEPEATIEPANRLMELKGEESAEIQRLLAELLQEILQRAEDVLAALEGLAWIDFTQARARLVRDLGFVVPALAESGCFRLRGARHPLLLVPILKGEDGAAALLEEIVPLDLDLGDPFSMLVVTGPNTGGKTVTLKTVGLLTLLAQSGIPVPAAEGTELPFTSAVFADIGDEQAIEQNLSTFSSHMTRIAHVLAHADADSLVLLDELGAGTDPEEGGALGYGILEQLYAGRIPTVATTHMGRLKDFAYQHEGVENGAMTFDPDALRPLFRLEVGIPGSSQALHIAGRVGVEESVLARAREILGQRDTSLDEMIGRIQRTRKAAEEQRRAAEETHLKARNAEDAIRDREEELSRKEAWLHEEAEQFVGSELRRARKMLEEPLRQFVNAPGAYGEKAKGMLKILESALSHSSLGKRRERYVEGLKKGMFVYLPRYRRRGKLRKVDRKRRILQVEAGQLTLDVPFEDVSWIQPLDSEGV